MKLLIAATAAGAILAAGPVAIPQSAAAPSTAYQRAEKSEPAVRAHDLMLAQRVLAHDGDYKGKLDGKSGPRTVAAIEQFQHKNGLKATGWLDEQTWNKIEARSWNVGSHQRSG